MGLLCQEFRRDPDSGRIVMTNYGARDLTGSYKGWAGAAVVLTVALGPLSLAHLGAHTKLVYTSQAVTVLYLVFRALGPKSVVRLRGKAVAALLILSMTPALLVAPVFRSAVVAYSNFTTGVLAAIVLATGFAAAGSGNYVRRAIYWLPVITAVQLIFSLRNATQVSQLHQNAHVSWGNSNYVAALIVTWVTLTVPYLIERKGSKILFLPQAFAVVVALLTLSRGATIAAAVGLASTIWWVTRGSTWRLAVRGAVALMPFGVILALGYISHLRSVQNHNAAVNVTNRFSLYRIAFHDFETSPLLGHGWVSLRAESSAALGGEQESFAHNLFASFLQMGGLTALPVLVFVVGATWTLCKRGSPLFPAALAGFAISMSDPFFEGYVGAMTMFGILIGGLLADRRSDSDHQRAAGGEIPQPSWASYSPRVQTGARG
jgi:hypothetical protein